VSIIKKNRVIGKKLYESHWRNINPLCGHEQFLHITTDGTRRYLWATAVKQTRCDGVEWIDLAQNRDKKGGGVADCREYRTGPLVLRSYAGPSAYEKRTLSHIAFRNVH